ncbi:flagellar-specific Sigma F (Sigma 28) factor [Citrobacter koseri]|uniref:Flagellar-specific Sigma F (Sigma 28) factor n=1 Tax=Citrobacter koseri TaxID=545 RepID=A0A3S5DNM8_CITKO|nr:flagellar-specific Sigma F (Sigma 28) factor [Citrobacter koseri]
MQFDRYDALQGTAFTTYAVQRIRGAMLDELRSRDWVPRSVRRNAREVAQAMGQLEQELGRNATETEVAERLAIPVEEYRQMLLDTNNSQLFSYDEWREEHGDSIELVTEEHQQENPLQQLLESNLRQRVMDAIGIVARTRAAGVDAVLPGRAQSEGDWRGAGSRRVTGKPVAQPGHQTSTHQAG